MVMSTAHLLGGGLLSLLGCLGVVWMVVKAYGWILDDVRSDLRSVADLHRRLRGEKN